MSRFFCKKIKFVLVMLLFLCVIPFAHINASAESCADIWLVQSIKVGNESIGIEFDTSSGGFQVVYMVEKDKTIRPLEYGKTFSVKVGEKIGWGDGDHAFNSIELMSINDGVASLIIGEEHRPPATHQNLAYNKSRECQIHRAYHPMTVHRDQEAIAIAKSDSEVKQFVQKWSSDFKVLFSASFYEKENAWLVRIYPKGVNDVEFHVLINPNGTIKRKYYTAI